MMQKNNIVHKPDGISRRISTRKKAHGVVALVNAEKHVIAISNDISHGGVSFFYFDDLDLDGTELIMDILLFETQTNKEHFFNQLKGRIRSKERVFDPENKEIILRFGVEFFDLDFPQREVLRSCLDQTDEYFLDF